MALITLSRPSTSSSPPPPPPPSFSSSSSSSSSLLEHNLGAVSLFDMSLKKAADSSDAAAISRLPSHILTRLIRHQQETVQDLRDIVHQREVHDRVMTRLAPVQYRLMAAPLDRRLVDRETIREYAAEAASIRSCWTVSSTPEAYEGEDNDDDETNTTSAWVRATSRDGEISTTLATNRLSHPAQSPIQNLLDFSQMEARLLAIMRRPVILGGGIGALIHRTGGTRLVFSRGGGPEEWRLRVTYHNDDDFDEAEEDALELCNFLVSDRVMAERTGGAFGLDVEAGTPAAVASYAISRWLSRQIGRL